MPVMKQKVSRPAKTPDRADAPVDPTDPYHHGNLRAALIRAADELLAEQGLEGFSLRAAARRAGVSPAAPAHHFGDTAGLLSEVATLGFEELARLLHVAGALTPVQKLRAQGVGYVRFALSHPGRFQLMFRKDRVSSDHAALQEAGARARGELEDTIRALHGIAPGRPLHADARSELLAAWALVHGFAHLALDGKLSHMHDGATPDELLKRVLPKLLRDQWPDR